MSVCIVDTDRAEGCKYERGIDDVMILGLDANSLSVVTTLSKNLVDCSPSFGGKLRC